MKIWNARGKQDGKMGEVSVRGETWKAAEAAARAEHGMEVRDMVLVGLPDILLGRLCDEHGWTRDRIVPVVSKDFPTAVGPKRAFVRVVVPDNGLGQIWLTGEYTSEGNNALVGCTAYLSQDSFLEELDAGVDAFAQRVTKTISETYAGRLLRPYPLPV